MLKISKQYVSHYTIGYNKDDQLVPIPVLSYFEDSAYKQETIQEVCRKRECTILIITQSIIEQVSNDGWLPVCNKGYVINNIARCYAIEAAEEMINLIKIKGLYAKEQQMC